jgi:uncharacterized protein YkwD
MSATLAWLAAFLLCFVAGESKTQAPKPKLLAIEANIIAHTNAERARYGLPPLEVDASLMDSARNHAQYMTISRRLVHTNQPVAENIATGQSSSEEAVQCWMNSPGHRANILHPRYRRIGAAAYRTPEGQIFWCQQFLW